MDLNRARRSANAVIARPRRAPRRLEDRYHAEDFGENGLMLYTPDRPAWDNPVFTREGYGPAPADPMTLPEQDLSHFGRRQHQINIDPAYQDRPGAAVNNEQLRRILERMLRGGR